MVEAVTEVVAEETPVPNKPHESYRYYALTLDPVHIGTGGSRLGRVDNAIVREPGTNLPKIPGTSICGVCRAYSAMAIQSADSTKKKYMGLDGKSCAGKGGLDGNGHCGKPTCEICVAFGFSKGPSNSSFQGLAQFFDARILLFPAYSMKGPVWVTCPSVLKDIGEDVDVSDGKFKALGANMDEEKLNFGWLYLERQDAAGANIDISVLGCIPISKDRIYVVPDKLFSRIVNDNLEVRTSVAIDPQTGAAEDGALYTYEAIPRATVIWFEVAYNKPEYFRIRKDEEDEEIEGPAKDVRGNVEKGFSLLAHLGLGGMNTRGMGRLRILKPDGEKIS